VKFHFISNEREQFPEPRAPSRSTALQSAMKGPRCMARVSAYGSMAAVSGRQGKTSEAGPPHQENGCQLFFDVYFSQLFFAYLTLYSHFGTSTFLDSRHSFYKYVLFTYLQLIYSFFTKRTKTGWKQLPLPFLMLTICSDLALTNYPDMRTVMSPSLDDRSGKQPRMNVFRW